MAYKWKKFMHGLENYGLAVADGTLSAVGATNVIKPEMYIGENKDKWAKAGDIYGGITQATLPIAMNIVAPGSGTIISGSQKAISKFANPTDTNNQNSLGDASNAIMGGINQMNQYKDILGSLPIMPYGGSTTSNVELEKQEVLRTPQGQIRQVNAPNHNQGGTGPMNLPNNTNILSDRLKAKTGKTFAEEGAKYNTSKWEKILETSNDPFQKKTAERMISFSNKQLSKLYAEQELIKANKLVKNTDVEKMMYGGNIKKYPYGGTPEEDMNNYYNNIQDSLPYPPDTMQVMNYALNSPGLLPNSTAPYIDPNQQVFTNEDPNSIGKRPPNELINRLKQFGNNVNDNLQSVNPYFTAATAGNFLGSIYDIYRGARGADEVNFDRVNPELVDYSKGRRMAVQEANRGFNATENYIKNATAGNAGAYLGNIGAASVNRDRMTQNMISQSLENEQNTNAQIRNAAKSQNAQIQAQESIARQQEKDIAKNTLATGLYNFGSALNTYGTDMQLKGNEPILKALITTGDYEYVYSKNGKPMGIKFKQNGKTTWFTQLTKQQLKEKEALEANLPK